MRLIKQLTITFAVIVVVNLLTSLYFTAKISELKKLVEIMYDNPLMASTYAMSAKYRFERVDSMVRTAVFEVPGEQLEQIKKEIKSQIEQGEEDLAVVQERAVADTSAHFAEIINANVADYKELIAKILKEAESSSNGSLSDRQKLLQRYLAIDVRNLIQKKLTELTDNAAETGYAFRIDSEAHNTETVHYFYIFAAGLILITLFLAFILFRTIARPLFRYSKTCLEISKGDYSSRVFVYGQESEIAVLGKALNQMMDKVDEKDRNMKSLLDGLNTAVFSFDKNGIIAEEKSKASFQIFTNYEFKNIFNFFKVHAGFEEKGLNESLALMWDPEVAIDFESLANGVFPTAMALPYRSETTEKYISLTYRQNLNSAGQLEKVIVLASDITNATLAQKNSILQAERVERITIALQNAENYIESKNNFTGFIFRCKVFLNQPSLPPLEMTELKRQLHSLKGELGLMGHKACSQWVHAVETVIAESTGPQLPSEQLIAALDRIESEFTSQADDVLCILGLDQQSKVVKVDLVKIDQLMTYVKLENQLPKEQQKYLLTKLQSLLRKPIRQYFKKYEDYVTNTAAALGKEVELVFDSESDEVAYKEIQHLDAIFGHLLRNSLDHGIEESDTRLELGKPQKGCITIAVHRVPNENKLQIVVRDDGRGIDHKRLVEKALQKSLWNREKAVLATQAEALNLIFLSDFSTKDVVTETSGRGVGMDAVRAEVENLGGTIDLKTEIGSGTSFIIHLPV